MHAWRGLLLMTVTSSSVLCGLDALAPLEFGSWDRRFVLFTGKGGVGKTTIAAASALSLARAGRRVLVVSTDPASNLGDVFGCPVSPDPAPVEGVPGLWVADLDPQAAAAAYRERVVSPYRGVLPASAIGAIEEQLSGACTVEVAAFGEFTRLLGLQGDDRVGGVDHVIFDTAPTGHTLRMLELPSAWEAFLSTSEGSVSCLGPLSALDVQRSQYAAALAALRDARATTVVLVCRPEESTLAEAARAGLELTEGGLERQVLVVNGILGAPTTGDAFARAFADRQARAWERSGALKGLPTVRFGVPLMGSGLTGLAALSALSKGHSSVAPTGAGTVLDSPGEAGSSGEVPSKGAAVLGALPAATLGAACLPTAGAAFSPLVQLVDDLEASGPSLVLVMGKGGVGKTTIAAALGVALARRGALVTLSTTDPAAHLTLGENLPRTLRLERIDPEVETAHYRAEVHAEVNLVDEEARAVLEEDLRSPCTEEIAVFRAFAATAAGACDRYVIVDTAPTGHTVLLLDAAQSYHRELARSVGVVPDEVTRLLPTLRDPERTKMIVVTHAETTPIAEAARLVEDLARAGMRPHGWVVNNVLDAHATRDPVLAARSALQAPQLDRVRLQAEHLWTVGWQPEAPVGVERLLRLTSSPQS